MKTVVGFVAACCLLPLTCFSQSALTIYNQNFAVVRDAIRLDLRQGVNELRYNGTTFHLEPDSVVLRDPTGKRNLQILEQNFRNDPVSQGLLLSLFEGKTIEFEDIRTENGQTKRQVVLGKIIRSGYVPHYEAMNRYGSRYAARQSAYTYSEGTAQPIIEVDGKLRFSLPGTPLFPTLPEDTILKPMLAWNILTDKPGAVNAELSYISGGLSWEADYNIIAPEQGETVDLVGWVTMDNQSGKSFERARIKLLAGDVNKIREDYRFDGYLRDEERARAAAPTVTEKSFDEYHIYTLQRLTTLLDRETKQVEFVRASGIKSQSVYVYDGAKIDQRFRNWDASSVRQNREYGTLSNPKVWVMREFSNSASNKLGMPLPAGKLRFYRRADDGQIEFTGENVIDHTPKDEVVRVFTGNAFDLVGSRKQTNFKIDERNNSADESFEIKLRNHKKTPVQIRAIEHLYRWTNWELSAKSDAFEKTDAQTIEFRVDLQPDEERTITYTVHYSW